MQCVMRDRTNTPPDSTADHTGAAVNQYVRVARVCLRVINSDNNSPVHQYLRQPRENNTCRVKPTKRVGELDKQMRWLMEGGCAKNMQLQPHKHTTWGQRKI